MPAYDPTYRTGLWKISPISRIRDGAWEERHRTWVEAIHLLVQVLPGSICQGKLVNIAHVGKPIGASEYRSLIVEFHGNKIPIMLREGMPMPLLIKQLTS